MQITTKHLYLGAGIIVVLLVFIFWPMKKVATTSVNNTTVPTQVLPDSSYKTTTLTMGEGSLMKTFTTEISDTPMLEQLGLSYRTSIAPDFAMLFNFAKPATYQFWMKDMSFPLDIIWLDANKKVVYIAKDLSPDTYPQSYGPSMPTQYVIEVAAGTVDRIGLKLGDSAVFTCGDGFCMR